MHNKDVAMDHNTINLNNINVDNSFDEFDSEISNKLLPAMWHPTSLMSYWFVALGLKLVVVFPAKELMIFTASYC